MSEYEEYVCRYYPDNWGEKTIALFGVPIVRCRDCVKWDYDSTYPKKACYEFSNPEDGYIIATSPDGFCAWGERE